MKLPGVERAHIDPTQVRDYLLSVSHPIGRSKAAFFRRLGYTDTEWQRREVDLRALAIAGQASPGEVTRHGRKFLVRGTLRGPSGKQAAIVTVWILRTGEETVRLVTAYPGGTR